MKAAAILAAFALPAWARSTVAQDVILLGEVAACGATSASLAESLHNNMSASTSHQDAVACDVSRESSLPQFVNVQIR